MTQEKLNQCLVKALENLQDAFTEVLKAYEKMGNTVDLAKEYPFANSLDEVAHDVSHWVENQKTLLSEVPSERLFECMLEDLASKTVKNCGDVFYDPSCFNDNNWGEDLVKKGIVSKDTDATTRLNIFVRKTIYAALVDAYKLGKQANYVAP